MSLSIQTQIKYKNFYDYKPLQLSDGSFIYYSYREILKYNRNLSFFGKLNNTYKEKFLFIESEKKMPEKIKKIVEIKDNLICCDENLFLYNIKSLKNSPVKYSLKLNDILKLSDGKLLSITMKNLILIDIESIIDELASNKIKNHHKIVFKFPDDWYIKPTYTKARENIYMQLLPNNKLLLHYLLVEREGKCKITSYHWNIIYILDLNNYRLIHSFKKFKKQDINIIVLSNYICIKSSTTLDIYNINDYKLVNNIELELNSSIKKYKDNILIKFNFKGDTIILFDLSNAKMIKKCIFCSKHIKGSILCIYTLNNLNLLVISRDIFDHYFYILQVNNLNFK